jgi:hypothetical protein
MLAYVVDPDVINFVLATNLFVENCVALVLAVTIAVDVLNLLKT